MPSQMTERNGEFHANHQRRERGVGRLPSCRRTHRVSDGTRARPMRQRLGLATALLADPDLLILDEPANGLDPEGIRWLRGLLRGFAAEGGTVLVSSHLLAEMAQTVDQVVIVDRGRLVAQGPVAGLTVGGAGLEDAFFQLTKETAP